MKRVLTMVAMLNKKKLQLYRVLFFGLAMVSCQVTAAEETLLSATLALTRTQSVTPHVTLTATTLSNISTTPMISPTVLQTPSRVISVTPSPMTALISPSPIPILITPSPSFPSEASMLIYEFIIDGESQIYTLQPGGTSHFITRGSLLFGESLSPDGTKIVIDTTGQSDSYIPDNVFILDLKTRQLSSLNLLGYPGYGIFWSREGSSLLYVIRYSDETADKIVLYNVTTKENQVLVEMDNILLTAGFSMDGQTVAFVAEMDGQYDLFTLNSTTLERQQLSDNNDVETMALWSPTTPQLLAGNTSDTEHVFEMRPWGIDRLYLLDINNADWQLLLNRFLTEKSVSWSPNGNQIVFSDQGLLCFKDLSTMTETCPLSNISPYNGYFASFREPPAWSADGSWLAFRAHNGTCRMIYFLELETNTIVPGDFGCDISIISPISPIYWTDINLAEFSK